MSIRTAQVARNSLHWFLGKQVPAIISERTFSACIIEALNTASSFGAFAPQSKTT
jgi:hypothetical protein